MNIGGTRQAWRRKVLTGTAQSNASVWLDTRLQAWAVICAFSCAYHGHALLDDEPQLSRQVPAALNASHRPGTVKQSIDMVSSTCEA